MARRLGMAPKWCMHRCVEVQGRGRIAILSLAGCESTTQDPWNTGLSGGESSRHANRCETGNRDPDPSLPPRVSVPTAFCSHWARPSVPIPAPTGRPDVRSHLRSGHPPKLAGHLPSHKGSLPEAPIPALDDPTAFFDDGSGAFRSRSLVRGHSLDAVDALPNDDVFRGLFSAADARAPPPLFKLPLELPDFELPELPPWLLNVSEGEFLRRYKAVCHRPPPSTLPSIPSGV